MQYEPIKRSLGRFFTRITVSEKNTIFSSGPSAASYLACEKSIKENCTTISRRSICFGCRFRIRTILLADEQNEQSLEN